MQSPNFSLADRKRIVDANYGRDFGWHVRSKSDEPIAELRDAQAGSEMFWTSYQVIPLSGHNEVHTESFWYPDCQRISNIAFPHFILSTFGRFDPASCRVELRSTHIPVDFKWVDWLRSPRWMVRRKWAADI